MYINLLEITKALASFASLTKLIIGRYITFVKHNYYGLIIIISLIVPNWKKKCVSLQLEKIILRLTWEEQLWGPPPLPESRTIDGNITSLFVDSLVKDNDIVSDNNRQSLQSQ